jgi:hypothetical protein
MAQDAPSNAGSGAFFDGLPFHAEHRSSRIGAVLMLMLLIPVLSLVMVPVALVLVLAADEVRAAVMHHPLPAAIVGIGLISWTALLLVPAKRIIQRFGNRRRVTIADEHVTVADDSLFGSRQWSAPLREFRGVTHHVRASLSGICHELILVHPVRDRCVLLHSARAIEQATLDRATALLRLQQIPAHEADRAKQRAAEASAIDALTQAQAA